MRTFAFVFVLVVTSFALRAAAAALEAHELDAAELFAPRSDDERARVATARAAATAEAHCSGTRFVGGTRGVIQEPRTLRTQDDWQIGSYFPSSPQFSLVGPQTAWLFESNAECLWSFVGIPAGKSMRVRLPFVFIYDYGDELTLYGVSGAVLASFSYETQGVVSDYLPPGVRDAAQAEADAHVRATARAVDRERAFVLDLPEPLAAVSFRSDFYLESFGFVLEWELIDSPPAIEVPSLVTSLAATTCGVEFPLFFPLCSQTGFGSGLLHERAAFRFTAPAEGSATFTVCNASPDVFVVAVVDEATRTRITCDAGACSGGGKLGGLPVTATVNSMVAGQNVFIVVTSTETCGAFTINATFAPSPPPSPPSPPSPLASAPTPPPSPRLPAAFSYGCSNGADVAVNATVTFAHPSVASATYCERWVAGGPGLVLEMVIKKLRFVPSSALSLSVYNVVDDTLLDKLTTTQGLNASRVRTYASEQIAIVFESAQSYVSSEFELEITARAPRPVDLPYGSCCAAHAEPSCDVAAIALCVCQGADQAFASCCSTGWSDECVNAALHLNCAPCGVDAATEVATCSGVVTVPQVFGAPARRVFFGDPWPLIPSALVSVPRWCSFHVPPGTAMTLTSLGLDQYEEDEIRVYTASGLTTIGGFVALADEPAAISPRTIGRTARGPRTVRGPRTARASDATPHVAARVVGPPVHNLAVGETKPLPSASIEGAGLLYANSGDSFGWRMYAAIPAWGTVPCGGYVQVAALDTAAVLREPPVGQISYAVDQYCEYTITAPEGRATEVTVLALDTEPDFDTLTIVDAGAPDAPLAVLSASSLPPAAASPFRSSGRTMVVRWSTDESVVGGGWSLAFQAVSMESAHPLDCLSGCTLGSAGGAVALVVNTPFARTRDWVLEVDGALTAFNVTLPGGWNATALYRGTRVAPSDLATAGLVEFVVGPGAVGSYVRLAFTSVDRNETSLNGSSLVYRDAAVDANCAREGLWYDLTDGACKLCPTGGYCPGGSRVWPYVEYWSALEIRQPDVCDAATGACCGALGERADSCPVQVDPASFVRVTARCDANLGYKGDYCTECKDGFYRDAGICRVCNANAKGELAAYIIAAIVILGIVSLGVAVAPVRVLTGVLSAIISIQQLVYIGRAATTGLRGASGERLVDLFRVLSIILFDVEFFKPACLVSSSFDFDDLFVATSLVALVSLAVLTVASAFHAVVGYRLAAIRCKRGKGEARTRGHDDEGRASGGASWASSDDSTAVSDESADQHEAQESASSDGSRSSSTPELRTLESSVTSGSDGAPRAQPAAVEHALAVLRHGSRHVGRVLVLGDPNISASNSLWRRLRARVVLAWVMALAFLHFMFALRSVQAVSCRREGHRWALLADLKIDCYGPRHLPVLVCAWVLLTVYVIGFPAVAFALMSRAFYRRRLSLLKIQFAFLTRSLRTSTFWWRLIGYALNVLLALQLALVHSVALRVTVCSISFLLNTCVVAWLRPFKKPLQNRVAQLVGVANAIQVVIMLRLSNHERTDLELLSWIVLGALLLALAVIAASVVYHSHRSCLRARCCADDHAHDEPPELAADVFAASSVASSSYPSLSFTSSRSSSSSSAPTSRVLAGSSDSLSELGRLFREHIDSSDDTAHAVVSTAVGKS